MKTTVIGQLVTAGGENCRSYFSSDPAHQWAPVRRKIWAIPACEVRSVQAPEIPLRLAHGSPAAGCIRHLERRPTDGSVWAVGELDVDIRPAPDTDYFLSVEATWDEGTGADIEIRGAALCERSAMIGLSPVTLIQNGVTPDGRAAWRLGEWPRSLLERSRGYRRAGAPILVHDERASAAAFESSPSGQLEIRSSSVAGVSGRTIELVVMPYEQETLVAHEGRMVTEIVSRGAFEGIEKRTNRVRVNRDHDLTRTVGRATRFHPSRREGLVAELRIAPTPLGDETLALAEDDCLDASAGFLPLPGGEHWETRSRRRLSKLWLGHIALTPDPAYEGARVLAVRGVR